MDDIASLLETILTGEFDRFEVKETEDIKLIGEKQISFDISAIDQDRISLGISDEKIEVKLDYFEKSKITNEKTTFLNNWDRIFGKLKTHGNYNGVLYDVRVKSRQIFDEENYNHIQFTIIANKEE